METCEMIIMVPIGLLGLCSAISSWEKAQKEAKAKAALAAAKAAEEEAKSADERFLRDHPDA